MLNNCLLRTLGHQDAHLCRIPLPGE